MFFQILKLLVLALFSAVPLLSDKCPAGPPCRCRWESVRVIQGELRHAIECTSKNLTYTTLPPLSTPNQTMSMVNLSRNQLEDIPRDYFGPVKNDILAVDLSRNHLRSIPRSLATLYRLAYLSLEFNFIDVGSGPLFPHSPILQYLDLKHNQISWIGKNTFSGASKLTYLYLGDNQIRSIHPEAFQENQILRYMNLTRNQLEDLDKGVFSGLRNLMHLDLTSNKILRLENGVFQDLEQLQQILLQNNNLVRIEAESFRGLLAATLLDLRQNSLSYLPDGVFDGLRIIQLDLRRNLFTEVNTSTFGGIASHIRALGLSDNFISEFPPGFFSVFESLQYLYFDRNPLKRIPDLTGLTHLVELSIVELSIRTIYECEFAAIPNLQVLWWTDQDLDCDCNVRWLRSKFAEHKMTLPRSNIHIGDLMVCQHPPRHKGKTFLELQVDDFACSGSQGPSYCYHVENATHHTSLIVHLNDVTSTSALIQWEIIDSKQFIVSGIEVVFHSILVQDGIVLRNETKLHLPSSAREYTLDALLESTWYNVCIKAVGGSNNSVMKNCTLFSTLVGTDQRGNSLPVVVHHGVRTDRTVVTVVPVLLCIGLVVFIILTIVMYRKVQTARPRGRLVQGRQSGYAVFENATYDAHHEVSASVEGATDTGQRVEPVVTMSKVQLNDESCF